MKRLAIFIIAGYQKFISPLFPPSCRYSPTCSHYARVALERHGFLRGGIMSAWRILRCGPWSKGGIDEVPEINCPVHERHSRT